MQFIKNLTKSYLFFIISVSISILIYSLIIYFSNKSISIKTINNISFFVFIFLFFLLGLYVGKINQKKGLMNSFITSLILLLFILFFKLITKTFNSLFIIKLLACLFTSSLGGIISINFKK